MTLIILKEERSVYGDFLMPKTKEDEILMKFVTGGSIGVTRDYWGSDCVPICRALGWGYRIINHDSK